MTQTQLGTAQIADGGVADRDLGFIASGSRSVRYWHKHLDDTTLVNDGMFAAPTINTNSAASSGDTTLRPCLTLDTAATTGSAGGIISTAVVTRKSYSPTWRVPFRTSGSIANVRYWIGLASSSLDAVATPTTHHVAAFRYDTGVDGTVFWRCITCDGASNVTTTTTTIAVATATENVFRVEIDTVAATVTFFIDNVQVAQHTTNLPGNTTKLFVFARTTTLENVLKAMRIGTCALIMS